jgi:hypothetical protein
VAPTVGIKTFDEKTAGKHSIAVGVDINPRIQE